MEDSNAQEKELGSPTSQEEATERNLALLIDALPEAGITYVKALYSGTPGDEWDFDLTDDTGVNLEADPPQNVRMWVRAGAPEQFELKEYEIVDALEEVVREVIDDTFENHSQRQQIGVRIAIDFDARQMMVANRVEREQEDYFNITLGTSSKPTGTSFVAGVSNVADAMKFNMRAITEAMRKAGATQASASYSGSGDDGSPIEFEHDLIDEERPVRMCELTAVYNQTPNGTTSYDIRITEKPVLEAMTELCEGLASDHHSGYEDGNGGGGYIDFDLKEGTVDYRAYSNICETDDGEHRTVAIPTFVEAQDVGLVVERKSVGSPRP